MARLILIVCLSLGSLWAGGQLVPESANPATDDRVELWSEVATALGEGLPRTAIGKLERIHELAVTDRDWPDAIRARARSIMLDGQINQPALPLMIREMTAAIGESPEPMRPVMRVILAEWFMTYYFENRWRFMQRSQTAAPPGDDFETWDLARLLKEIDLRFAEALESADQLKAIPVSDYNGLLVAGNVPDRYRPTLFDFVANQALQFYALDEQFIGQQDAFEISGDSPALAAAPGFLQWDPQSDDEDSYLLRAVRLYQELMRFHEDDDDPSAFLDADLRRLRFAATVARGSEVKSRYRAALQRFADEQRQHPLSALALGWLAQSLQADEENVEALAHARTGQARFPGSNGGQTCFNVIETILQPALHIQTEQVWNKAGPTIDISYRNLDKVYFRLVRFDYRNWNDWGHRNDPVYANPEDDLAWTRRPVIASWSTDLPATKDYRIRDLSVPANPDVAPGCYILLASTNPEFSETRNRISATAVWVSELATVMRTTRGSMQLSGQVLNALSGRPLEGAEVLVWAWEHNGRNSRDIPLEPVRTDANGFFSVTGHANSSHKLLVSHEGQTLGFLDQNFLHGKSVIAGRLSSSILLTDRSIYRPGQPIEFKAIVVSADQVDNRYRTLSGQPLTVALFDLNNEVVEKQTFRTNEFGSVSGTFTAPRHRATGPMTLRVASGPSGQTGFRVEEYKRPRFFVEVDPPETATALGQAVTLPARATGYSGAPVDGARVNWRVVRNTEFPRWYYWTDGYHSMPDIQPAEIAHGTTRTGRDGEFRIEFVARPETLVERDSQPRFTYTIHADVTDTAGETRSATQSVTLGYTSLQAALEAPAWLTSQQPVPLSLTVSTLDGEGQESSGTLRVYSLTPPDTVQRARLNGQSWMHPQTGSADDPFRQSSIEHWQTGELLVEEAVTTAGNGGATLDIPLPAGAWKAVYQTSDPAGHEVRAEQPLLVVDPEADRFAVKIPNYLTAESWTVEPGDALQAIWGTGYEQGQAFVELEHRGRILKSWWTAADTTQTSIRVPIEESMRGGLQLRLTYVRDNRAYTESRSIDVPWSNKRLKIRWEHFVSGLQPGGKETWTAVVEGPDAELASTEFLATMYDASLDAFLPHTWPDFFRVFYRDQNRTQLQFCNRMGWLHEMYGHWNRAWQDDQIIYRHFADGIGDPWICSPIRSRGRRSGNMAADGQMWYGAAEGMADAIQLDAPASAGKGNSGGLMRYEKRAGEPGPAARSGPDPGEVSPRRNLQETAFFYPNLRVAEDGTVRIEFEIPEALTSWKFLGFAHDNRLRSARLIGEMKTSKDLMAQPNPPRFLREGDELQFSVKLTNQSDRPQNGVARLSLADARTGQSLDADFISDDLDQAFEVPAGASLSLFWTLKVPDFAGVLTWKAVAATDSLSDGEEGFLPVLSKRILVVESLPLPIRGRQTRQFDFQRLRDSINSDTLKSESLTVQMASNPAWYAVLALPYLMEYPHQCSEQVFNRLYANALGAHIVNSDPKIERVFDQWRGTGALDSPLLKNEDLRNALIAESPWLLAARDQSRARRHVGLLFDANRMRNELQKALGQLEEMQHSDGAWPWFPGGPANDYITLYVTTGFGRLRHLGVDVDVAPAVRSLDRLDTWIGDLHEQIVRLGIEDKNNLSPMICLYLYGRSFFLEDQPVAEASREAFDYFVDQARRYWVKLDDRQPQGHLAIALKRIGDRQTPGRIIDSLLERSLKNEETGMFWRESQQSWWWYRAPIETQALMIEVFDEVADDALRVEECKVWLLEQKHTQNWKTTRATADAVYALLLRGTDLLASDQLVTVSLGERPVEPGNVEAGTGFYEQRFVREEIRPDMGSITVAKADDGVAWGSVHWQYLEDVSKIEPYEGTPLTVRKDLYVKRNTGEGPVIERLDGPVSVGDELVMRIELRVDRDMEYVHLKDYRGSGTEPLDVLSRYKYQDGLAYYESTRDTASHFFIDYLPRGTYVFEYPVRVQHRGRYETGIAELQCMYAPEFNSHSGSVELVVE